MSDAVRQRAQRILIVDDDPDIHQLLRHILGQHNYDLTSTGTATDAFSLLQSPPEFDLVLLDLGLPDMSGLDLLARLKAATLAPRVIVVTADNTSEAIIRALRQQAYDYVRKPFSPEEIDGVIERALRAAEDPDFEVISAKPDWLEISIPCTRDAAERVENYVRQLNSSHGLELSLQVGQVFRELVMNAVEWGGKLDSTRRTRIACIRTKRMLLYRIADPGPGFVLEEINHASFANPDPVAYLQAREAKGLRPGGLGIVMVTALADEVLYNEARNEVLFVKFLPSSNRA
jgi:DNA-binding response OmpR family regulator